MKFIDKLEKRFGRHSGIKNLMLYISLGSLVVYFFTILNPSFASMLSFSPAHVLRGQIWRIFTFMFIPPNSSMIFIAFALYLYYLIGSTLENVWGTFRFNLFYFTGAFGTALACLVIYWATGISMLGQTYYINMSLFLAFAILFPDFELRLFFMLPVKIKWLALIYTAMLTFNFIMGNIVSRVLIVVSLANIILFFGNKLFKSAKNKRRKREYQKAFEPRVINDIAFHKCTICGVTEKDNPNMQFRYCSKCNGTYEYCMDHLDNHEHIQ